MELQNVTVCYRRHPAVHHLSGHFRSGSLTAVIGPNGAGKSTLLKGLAGVIRPNEGRVIWQGLRTRDVAYLPQQVEIDRSFPLSVSDVVSMGHWRRVGLFRALRTDLRSRVAEALAAVGLDGFARRAVGTLSAGQFQRALFARMLLQDAPLILLDEPFNAIDARTTADLLAVVRRWHGERRTVIAVLHDVAQVREHFPETLLLAREGIAWGRTGDVLTGENLLRARSMAEAWDERAAPCETPGRVA
ncbi:MAG: metal ABC transporter ATP-binding protein [Ectothiorhodospiraceae bacterium]|nr:metal ABC transporter ATP-binding protein [Ectothiorhodospiraceae bacterium]